MACVSDATARYNFPNACANERNTTRLPLILCGLDPQPRDGEARRQMLAIFNLAANDPDLVSEYRGKLARALY